MNWNIFKRVAELEQKVKDLTDFNNDNSRFIGQLEGKLNQTNNKLFVQEIAISKTGLVPDPRMPVFATDEVDEGRINRRQYKRDWYAKKVAKIKQEKNAQAARERKNAYARAYYARTKGAKK